MDNTDRSEALNSSSALDALNSRVGIPGIAHLIPGPGGLPKIQIGIPAGSAEIYLHGAQVTSWIPNGTNEVIFLSSRSRWEDGRAIRGGIPICFPWFRAKVDDPKAPAHGFVRTRAWELDAITQEGNVVVATLSTRSDESTKRWWPGDFHLRHKITVGAHLQLELTVTNAGSAAFTFEEALHTYFKVGDAQAASVHGLNQVRYLDNTDGNREKVQAGNVTFSSATDNAYRATQTAAELIDPVLRRVLRTEKENSATTVVWNPWQQGAAALADLGDDEWRTMACVEACNILDAKICLAPGQQHTMRATLSVVSE